MRETSPAVGISVDEWLVRFPECTPIVTQIRRQKETGARLRPSATLVDRSSLMTQEHRGRLLDRVAALVDENYVGRSEMCLQFAALLHRALSYLQFPSRDVVGTATYYDDQKREIFRWKHAWVRVGDEVIDGNVDSLAENPRVPKEVRVARIGVRSRRRHSIGASVKNTASPYRMTWMWTLSGGQI